MAAESSVMGTEGAAVAKACRNCRDWVLSNPAAVAVASEAVDSAATVGSSSSKRRLLLLLLVMEVPVAAAAATAGEAAA
jgi:hypothetical protein